MFHIMFRAFEKQRDSERYIAIVPHSDFRAFEKQRDSERYIAIVPHSDAAHTVGNNCDVPFGVTLFFKRTKHNVQTRQLQSGSMETNKTSPVFFGSTCVSKTYSGTTTKS